MPNDSSPATALVTGAGRGLGRALVDALLARGAVRVYATARRPADRSRLAAAGAIPLSLDLTRPAEIRAAAAAAGAVDLLVNNAGAAAFAPLLSAPRADIEREIATNVLGTLDLTRALLPAMPAGAIVVNVLSLLSLAATPAMAGYSASKAAAHSMTQALRPALAERDIRVVGVYPGAIDTDMLAGVEMVKADPRDVAEAILDGVAAGQEDVFPDPMAVEMSGIWRTDPKAFERAFAALAP